MQAKIIWPPNPVLWAFSECHYLEIGHWWQSILQLVFPSPFQDDQVLHSASFQHTGLFIKGISVQKLCIGRQETVGYISVSFSVQQHTQNIGGQKDGSVVRGSAKSQGLDPRTAHAAAYSVMGSKIRCPLWCALNKAAIYIKYFLSQDDSSHQLLL